MQYFVQYLCQLYVNYTLKNRLRYRYFGIDYIIYSNVAIRIPSGPRTATRDPQGQYIYPQRARSFFLFSSLFSFRFLYIEQSTFTGYFTRYLTVIYPLSD